MNNRAQEALDTARFMEYAKANYNMELMTGDVLNEGKTVWMAATESERNRKSEALNGIVCECITNCDCIQKMKENSENRDHREIKLEAIIDAYQKLIENFLEKSPFQFPQFKQLDNVSQALFNAAEVREDIEELVNFGVEYEK